MFVPDDNEDYYSVKYSNTYVVFINTSRLNQLQIKWLKLELALAQKYYWIIVVGQASLERINLQANFTQLFMDHHTDIYMYYGDFYGSSSLKYPLTEHMHNHFQDTSELLLIQQGPSRVDKKVNLHANNSIYATSKPGYGIITPKYSTLLWQEFNSETHHLINEVVQHRIDLDPRKEDEVRNFKIIFVVTFLLFLAAFVQTFVSKELEKRKLTQHKPLESGVIEF